MTTISPNRRGRAFSPRFFLTFTALLVCIGIVVLFRNPLSSIFWRASAPLVELRLAAGNSLGRLFAQFSSKASLEEQNERLRAALASTTVALADRNALFQENLLLKNAFGRDAGTGAVLAAVLMQPPATPYDTLVIDAGSSDGVVQGAVVSAGGTTVIGRISAVYAHQSQVTLFSAPGESYQGLLLLSAQGNLSVPLSVVGQGAGSMMGEVPAGTPVSVGDSVELPGIAVMFSASVSYIEAPEGQSFETVYMQLPVDLFSLHYVEVRPASGGTGTL